ncbi:rod shape-determining protein MreC [Candidatus Vallotia lariciata]|uniref:rod shape-determining protein MreC n=1 Tax=Candidatus Vallotia laricis TaxID=2018052 RepID=UPI001D028CDA|nr:rod shape-determining protein MreC [Candidatus Vallotia lariciata]UDG83368.1 Cell shape-determining protein MreC [Candidatus Vallotia lariciata]
MEYSPPPLFKRGLSPHTRLIIFVSLALALLVTDARFRAFEAVRKVIVMGLYPMQYVALVPRDLLVSGTNLLVTVHSLHHDNKTLRDKNLQLLVRMSQAAQLRNENEHLRELLQLQRNSMIRTIPTEVCYDTRDPFTQKVIIDSGEQQDIQIGAPVVNEKGVVGQVTRVFPLQSEVTLLTDKDQAVPVQILRTGIRSVIYGTPKGDTLDLKFVLTSADVKIGDELVTNGLDGIYPPGLPVAKVIRVDKKSDTIFSTVVCSPCAPVRSARQLLVLRYEDRPSRPIDANAVNKVTRQEKDKKSAEADADNNIIKSDATPSSTSLAGV